MLARWPRHIGPVGLNLMGGRLVSVIQRKPTSTNCGGEFSQQGGAGGEGGAEAGGGGAQSAHCSQPCRFGAVLEGVNLLFKKGRFSQELPRASERISLFQLVNLLLPKLLQICTFTQGPGARCIG